MDSIEKINTELDKIATKYNIPLKSNNQQSYTLVQTIQLLNKLDKKINSNTNTNTDINVNSSKSQHKFGILEELTSKLESELCEKESKNVDHILNEIIGCIRNETIDSRTQCANQVQKILDENYFKSNIKNKLKALIELLIKI